MENHKFFTDIIKLGKKAPKFNWREAWKDIKEERKKERS